MLADVALPAEMPGAEKARAQAIATGVLRHMAGLDHVLAGYLKKPPPDDVRRVLQIAAWELLADGVAPHAAVDSAVRLVRGLRGRQTFAGLANAVCRRISREGAEIWAARPAPALPGWLRGPVADAWGDDAADAIAAAHLVDPPLDLTPRSPVAAEAVAEAVEGMALPTGSVRLARAGQISRLPGYDTGDWWVQDAAAAIPARLLGDISGLRVLDLCAAPGGKTMQLAAAGAEVTAVDQSGTRLKRLSANLARTGLAAKVVEADALDWTPDAPFDAILLDAPCSATGTLRRHPDLPFVRPDPDLAPLLRLQGQLIDRAAGWLRPGGRLVYCTCSLLMAEGEGQISAALTRNPDLAIDLPGPPPGVDPDWIGPQGLRLRPDHWPERGGMDGFFATVLRKAADAA